MSRLLQLFTQRGAFFLFLFLEIISFFLIIRYNANQQEVAAASWSLYAGRYMERVDRFRNYFSLEQENENLLEHNARLLAKLESSFDRDSVQVDSIRDDSIYYQRYAYIAGEIINKSPLSANINYVINKGHIHGVEKHQGVISKEGVVGIVTAVSPRHARVMSLLHRDIRLSAAIKNEDYFGSLFWQGGDARFAYLSKIPEYADVSKGDTIQTTGYSNIFPTGVDIGQVEEISALEGENLLLIKVKLFNDFFSARNVYVVRNLLKDDLEQLDEQSQ